ncbi:hypothetical protein [Pseudostreptobacillus hongkongensis]|uniref:hypothetical protein n=1 Tax=Pseudostreptobacillus hongkongensis TaxID=1162717 RepID=UPI00082FFBB5|nr:hypothetical protein [Pseudostreptobacillus hongkongensis]
MNIKNNRLTRPQLKKVLKDENTILYLVSDSYTNFRGKRLATIEEKKKILDYLKFHPKMVTCYELYKLDVANQQFYTFETNIEFNHIN